jgi:hypothetical protein
VKFYNRTCAVIHSLLVKAARYLTSEKCLLTQSYIHICVSIISCRCCCFIHVCLSRVGVFFINNIINKDENDPLFIVKCVCNIVRSWEIARIYGYLNDVFEPQRFLWIWIFFDVFKNNRHYQEIHVFFSKLPSVSNKKTFSSSSISFDFRKLIDS